MKTFKAYLRPGAILRFEAGAFKVGSYMQRYHFKFQKGDEVDANIFLAFYEVAAVVPVIDSAAGSGFKVHLKNGHSFDVIAHRFERDAPRIRFFDSSDNLIRSMYVAEEDVVAIFPTDNPAVGV